MKQQILTVWESREPLLFFPGEEKTVRFDCGDLGRNPRLFLRGEPATDPIRLSEAGSAVFCRDIDDALSTDAATGRFSLRFPAWDDPDPRRAWYRLVCAPLTYPGGFPVWERPAEDRWHLSVAVKAEDFRPAGDACLRVEFYRAKPGRDPKDLSGEADTAVTLHFPAGSYAWRTLETDLPIPPDTACLLVCVSVGAAEGTLWVDSPRLCGTDDRSLLPAFAPASARGKSLRWTAENLARGDRSEMFLTLNGRSLGRQILFASIYRYAQTELPLPEELLRPEGNELTLRYVPDCFCPNPYRLVRVMLTQEEPGGAFSVVSCPHTAAVGRTFPVVIEAFRPSLTLTVRSDCDAVLPESERITFPEPGLHAVRFCANGITGSVTLTLSDGETEETVTLARTVQKGDAVLVGTSDAVYIPQSTDAMREFLKSYLSGEWGNFLTFRPVYHWSGTRSCQAAVWRALTRFLTEARIPYALLFDERELEGLNANPPRALLESPYFLGFQGHERDGAYYYWGDGMFGDDGEFFRALRAKKLNHPDVSYRMPPKYRNGTGHLYYDTDEFDNAADAADTFQRNLNACLRGCSRHTGVTLLFRHFLRAGIDVIGAELMYGSHEILLSGLRGNALAYGKTETLSHLALQWHAEPVGGAAYNARYALSLRLSYLHGVTQINTEEGLWWTENGFVSHDRFSPVCRGFQETERDFLRYVSCHTRSGTPARRHALLFGTNENFPSYTDCSAWHKDAPGWEYGQSERAWEQIRLFYPAATLTHPRTAERYSVTQEPGWYSPTPYGLCDILPAEAPGDVLSQYPYLAFAGYNTADAEQVERLIGYVRGGGRLLLCLCHLTTDTNRGNSRAGDYCTDLLPGYERLTGFPADMQSADGAIHRHRIGQGEVLTVASYAFPVPGTPCGEVYAGALRSLAQASDRSAEVRAEIGDARVEYGIWNEADGRATVRLCGVAWNTPEKTETVRLIFGGKVFSLPVRPCEITTVTVSADRTLAVQTLDERGEVLSLTREGDCIRLTVQGEDVCRFRLFGRTPDADGEAIEIPLCGSENLLFPDKI